MEALAYPTTPLAQSRTSYSRRLHPQMQSFLLLIMRTLYEYGDSRLAPFVEKIEREQPAEAFRWHKAAELRLFDSVTPP